jgi:transposase
MANFTLPLDIDSLNILSQHIDSKGNIIFTVESKCTETICHKCGKSATKRIGTNPPVDIRHTSILDTPVILRIKPVRYECEHCADRTTTTEKYDWVSEGGKVTKGLEKYILRSVISSTIQDVSRKEDIGYRTIERVIANHIPDIIDWNKIDTLHTIGIDEISNRKGYRDYVAVVTHRDEQGVVSVLAILDIRRGEDVLAFFNSIPERLRKTVKHVCTDMHDGFVYPAIEVFGQQKVVVDRYHVAKLYRGALDKLRVKEMARLKDTLNSEEYSNLENMMWILRKKHECLSKEEKQKLQLLYKYSPLLKEAHSLAIKLTHIFNTYHDRKAAQAKLDRWVVKVQKSKVKCFDTFVKTLSKYRGCIVNYFKNRETSGFVEGINNKIKVIKRRCYGFFKTETLFRRLTLDLSGYQMVGI